MKEVFKRPVYKRIAFLAAVAAVAAAASIALTNSTQRTYLTLNPSVSQRFVAVPNEEALVDLCYRLRGVYGVTGVSYREYSTATRSARVTLFFDPKETSVRQLRIFMLHTRILWQQEMNA